MWDTQSCGGIQGLTCRDGFKCRFGASQYEYPYPDAAGSCVADNYCDAPADCLEEEICDNDEDDDCDGRIDEDACGVCRAGRCVPPDDHRGACFVEPILTCVAVRPSNI